MSRSEPLSDAAWRATVVGLSGPQINAKAFAKRPIASRSNFSSFISETPYPCNLPSNRVDELSRLSPGGQRLRGTGYHHRYHEQHSGKAHYLLSEQVAFHSFYSALVRVPIASFTLIPDAPSPVSFARNTVLGWFLSMAWRFEAGPEITVSELSLELG